MNASPKSMAYAGSKRPTPRQQEHQRAMAARRKPPIYGSSKHPDNLSVGRPLRGSRPRSAQGQTGDADCLTGSGVVGSLPMKFLLGWVIWDRNPGRATSLRAIGESINAAPQKWSCNNVATELQDVAMVKGLASPTNLWRRGR